MWNSNINMRAIHKIEKPLTDLNNMIGLSNLKLSIMDQILYFIQNLHKDGDRKSNDFMHTVILWTPGNGKNGSCQTNGKNFQQNGSSVEKCF